MKSLQLTNFLCLQAVRSIQSEDIKKTAIQRQKKIITLVCNIMMKNILFSIPDGFNWIREFIILCRSCSWPAPSSCAGHRTRCWPWPPWWACPSPSVPSSPSCLTSWPSPPSCGTPSYWSYTTPWSVNTTWDWPPCYCLEGAPLLCTDRAQ